MALSALVVGYYRFTGFLSLAAGLYIGAFILHLPIMPPDPLVPLGLILGIPIAFVFSLIGASVGLLIRYITNYAFAS